MKFYQTLQKIDDIHEKRKHIRLNNKNTPIVFR